MDVESAVACVDEIPPYNRFQPDDFKAVLRVLPDHVRVVVGRESSPAFYIWTVAAPTVMTVMKGITPDGGVIFEEPTSTVPPDEMGGIPHANTYPVRTVGKPAADLNAGTPVLVRLWYD